MGYIITLVTALVIATSASGISVSNIDNGGGAAMPHAINQEETLQCNAPCVFDEETNTFLCPC